MSAMKRVIWSQPLSDIRTSPDEAGRRRGRRGGAVQMTRRMMFSIMMASLATASFQVFAGVDVGDGDGEEDCDGEDCDEVCHACAFQSGVYCSC